MYVYCIIDESGRRKLGFTDDVDKRLPELQTGNAEKLKIEYRLEVKNMRRAETSLHHLFAADIIRMDGEWYKIKDLVLLKKVFRKEQTTEREEKLLERLGFR